MAGLPGERQKLLWKYNHLLREPSRPSLTPVDGIERNTWIKAASYLTFYFQGKYLACGSGFFWQHKSKLFLITNWHCVTGRSAISRKPLSPTGGVPDEIKFTYWKRYAPPGFEGGLYQSRGVTVSLPLYPAGNEGRPAWGQHRRYGHFIDTVCFDVTFLLQDPLFDTVPANEIDDAAKRLYQGQPATVVGYYKGLRKEKDLRPLFITGKITSDPNEDPNNWPMILVDCPTETGMSGSFALVRTENNLGGFIGVYSGRIDKGKESQGGIIWKRRVIEEMLEAPNGGVAPDELEDIMRKTREALLAAGYSPPEQWFS